MTRIPLIDVYTLDLPYGEHEISIVTRATGRGSARSNTVSYAILSGTWDFYYEPNIAAKNAPDEYDITFESNGVTYSKLRIENDGIGLWLYFDNVAAYYFNILDGIYSWFDDAYRMITFPVTQEVTKEFYEWFTSTANKDLFE